MINSNSSNADVLSWALTMSAKKEKPILDSENMSPNKRLYDEGSLQFIGRSNADILDYALTLSSKKTKHDNNNDNNDHNDNDCNNNNIISNLDNDYNNIDNIDNEYNNDNNTDSNANAGNDHMMEIAKLDKKQLHSMLKDKVANALEFELIDLLNKGSYDELIQLRGIGKKFAQNILDLRDESFKFESLSQIEEIGIPKSKIGDFINKNLGIILTRL